MPEVSIFYIPRIFNLWPKSLIFLLNKTKKINKIEKNTLILAKLEKLAFNLMMNITKMGKMQKSEKSMIIFAKIWTDK